jgi:uridylate kinase
LPIVVFELMRAGNIKRVIWGEPIGTFVGGTAKGATPAIS